MLRLERILSRLKALAERDVNIIRRLRDLEGRVRRVERDKLDRWK